MKQGDRYVNKFLRLKEYDYSYPGAYFVTICVNKRKYLFGEVKDGKRMLNELGKIAENNLVDMPNHFENTEIVAYVVMPNHVHAVVNMYDDIRKFGKPENLVGGRYICHLQGVKSQIDMPERRQYQKLPVIIGTYKAAVTREINKLHPAANFKWQRYYHDHIIRNDKALGNICEYIRQNPANWDTDLENEMHINNITVNERERRLKQFYKKLAGVKP
jgi:putative transposase